MSAGLAKGPDLAGVKMPAMKWAAANATVRTADQKPSRLEAVLITRVAAFHLLHVTLFGATD